MPKHRLFIGFLALSAVVAGYSLYLRSGQVGGLGAGLTFLLALTIVGAFDVWLPRGDYTEMGAPLVVAAGILLSPFGAVIVAVLSRTLVWGTRRFSENPWRVVEDISRRVTLMSLSILLFDAIGGRAALRAGHGTMFLGVTLAVSVTYLLSDLVVTQLSSSLRLGIPFMPLLVGNLRLRGWMGTAQASAAMLAIMTYRTMGWLGLGIVVGLLLVTRQSFSLLIDVRQAYRSTVEALARAIEAHDPRRRGHAERVAGLSVEVGRLLGQHGRRLEALTYAALFHDVGTLDADDVSGAHGHSAEVLETVGFLAASVPVLRIIDAGGGIDTSQDEADLVSAYVVARMCEFDDRQNDISGSPRGRAAEDIGARLYARTRRDVDRALHRTELRSKAGRLRVSKTELEGSW